MKQYIDLVTRILEEGGASDDRTGTGTIKIFGHQSIYNMDDGFPLLTLKNTWMKGVTHELLWLLGCHMKDDKYKNLEMTNIKYMVDNNVNIWNEWAHERYIKECNAEVERLRESGALVDYQELSLEKYIEYIKNGNEFSGESAEQFAKEAGKLGPVYGKQWVDWNKFAINHDTEKGTSILLNPVNQIQTVIDKLTKGHKNFNPMDRGLVVSAWNVGELDDMALRPCHAFFQFQARELTSRERMSISENYGNNHGVQANWDVEKGYLHKVCDDWGVPKYELSLQLYQRSADTFLGVPFNIASYSLLLHMFCHVTGMKPGKFVHSFGDAHLYSNHKEQVEELLSRTNNGTYYGPELPTIWLNPEVKNIFDFTYDDIKVVDYKPFPTIKAEVSV